LAAAFAALLLSSVAAQAATAPVPHAVVTDNARDAQTSGLQPPGADTSGGVA